MRFVIASPTFPRNVYSPEHWLARGLIEIGHEATVLATDRVVERSTAWGKQDPAAPGDVPVRYLKSWTPHREPLRARGVREAVAEGRYDFGIVAEDWRPTSFQFAAALKERGIPFMVDSERAGYFMGPVRSVLHRRQDSARFGGGKAWRMWRDAVALTCHSTASADFHLRIGTPPSKVRYIPAATDTRLFRPPAEPERGREGTAHVLTIGRLEPQKGQEIMVEAAHQSAGGWDLTIKGRGPLRAALGELVEKLGVGDKVFFDERVLPREDLPAYYAGFDIYVQTSYDEPFGMAAVDAMACGLPVIATDVGGLRDSVEEGVNGHRFGSSPGWMTEGGLSAAVDRLAADPDLRWRFGAASRRIAEEKFDCRVVAAAHARIAGAGK
jgi:glycosyltransferase involved in cell wall biosynthesis